MADPIITALYRHIGHTTVLYIFNRLVSSGPPSSDRREYAHRPHYGINSAFLPVVLADGARQGGELPCAFGIPFDACYDGGSLFLPKIHPTLWGQQKFLGS